MPYLLWLRYKDKLGDFDFKADIPDMRDQRQQPTLEMFKKGHVGGQVKGFIHKDCTQKDSISIVFNNTERNMYG